MKTLKFKTNINCGGCVAKATPILNAIEGIQEWKVDTTNKDKILKATTSDALNEEEIMQKLKQVGFVAKPVN